MVRAYAREWNIDPHKIGIMGFSAGGELAAPAAVLFDDFDKKNSEAGVTTEARPDEIERLVRGWADDVWTQGARFGTIGCRRAGRLFEITTHRAEVYVPDSRKPEVTFGDDVEEDLSRRDFTINALALRLPDMELVDPFGGLADLAAGRLRTPLDPEVSFGDDPLRMLRARALHGPLRAQARRHTRVGDRSDARSSLHCVAQADPR